MHAKKVTARSAGHASRTGRLIDVRRSTASISMDLSVSSGSFLSLSAWLGLGISSLSGAVSRKRRSCSTALRYKVADVNQEPASEQPFSHAPRAERMAQKLPFSGDEDFWDFIVYPKALFPWSPEGGGRPWHAITDSHKSRLALVLAVHAGCLLAPFTFSWDALQVSLVLSYLTIFGVTCSYHRQLSHKAFECPKWLEYLFAYFACLTIEGGPIAWVRMHRLHHLHSDGEGDIHSPMDGFWWGHMGFMFDPSTPEKLSGVSNTRDMDEQWFYRLMDDPRAYITLSVFLPIAVLFACGGSPYVVWGFCVRTAFVWHMTWAVNSIGHIWGYQSYKSGDHSMNNLVLGVLALGDGWHNNHHAFPRSCRHGLEWYEIDIVWYVLLLLNAVGLVWNLQYPSQKRIEQLAL